MYTWSRVESTRNSYLGFKGYSRTVKGLSKKLVFSCSLVFWDVKWSGSICGCCVCWFVGYRRLGFFAGRSADIMVPVMVPFKGSNVLFPSSGLLDFSWHHEASGLPTTTSCLKAAGHQEPMGREGKRHCGEKDSRLQRLQCRFMVQEHSCLNLRQMCL